LKGIKSDSGLTQRLIHEHMQTLEKWRPTVDEPLSNSNMKAIIGQAIDQLFQILDSIVFIHQNAITDQMKTMRPLDHFNDIQEQLRRLREINEKEYNTICIIGLEKAGKSSFINALLGFELLPFK
jgi:ribosome biogenesis GTPase A